MKRHLWAAVLCAAAWFLAVTPADAQQGWGGQPYAGPKAFGGTWGQSAAAPDWNRFYHYPYVWYPQRTGRVDLAFSRARETGTLAKPAVRQSLARLLMLSTASEYEADAVVT